MLPYPTLPSPPRPAIIPNASLLDDGGGAGEQGFRREHGEGFAGFGETSDELVPERPELTVPLVHDPLVVWRRAQ